MTRLYCDGPTLMRAVAAAVANLEAHVEEVDSLNVFPVPDGDTGSNMLATMRTALAEAERLPDSGRDLHAVAEALSRGALIGARGNSGVILSQIIRGMTSGADGRRRATGLDLAEGLRRGSEVAYGSVLTPVEGTILTVIRDAAQAAEMAADRQPHVEAVLAASIEAAASSVQRTPMLLPILEDAGVVDSGGQGLFRLLEGTMQVDGSVRIAPSILAEAAISESRPAPAKTGHAQPEPHLQSGSPPGAQQHDHAHTGAQQGEPAQGDFGYETEYVLSSPQGRLDLSALRDSLQGVGDSVIVAGDERLARVHVHGERPDAALAVGLAWGRLSQVSVIDLDEQAGRERGAQAEGGLEAGTRAMSAHPTEAASASTTPALAVVAVAGSEAFAHTFESLGARVVRPTHGSRPSVGEIATGILACGASEVIVLPNDRDAILAAGQADELTPMVSVRIVPTRNAAEGVVAALAFDPAASLATNLAIMEAEASALRSFSVSRAARDSVVDRVPVRAGQLIALDPGRRILACEDSVEAATLQALMRYEDFELVTCYPGAEMDESEIEELRERILEAGWGAEVEVVPGGQRHEQLLVAVE